MESYFSHDSNANQDPKCILLIDQWGPEGYGIFWLLIEMLREQPDYKYPINLISALSRRFNTTAEKISTVVFNYNLFKIENDEFFYSESLLNRMQIMDDKKREKSEKRSIAGKLGNEIRWGSIAKVSQSDHKSIAKIAKLNEIKLNEKKVNKKKEFIPPTIQDLENYAKERGYKINADRIWHGYNEANWHDSQNNPIHNWKQKLNQVWFKDENKITSPPINETKRVEPYKPKNPLRKLDLTGGLSD